MAKTASWLAPLLRSLSARLLVLTIIFVLLGEVLIFVPSIARFRLVYLQEHIASARLAALAVEAAPDQMITEEFGKMLLERADVLAISLKRPGLRTLLPSPDMPTEINATYDLDDATPLGLVRDAYDTLRLRGKRIIRVMGRAPHDDKNTLVDIVMNERPLFAAMLDYSRRILLLSIVLALITAGLVFLSLHFLLVRPLGRITESLVAFRRNPEDVGTVVSVSGRRDEIGLAQRELRVMQQRVRAALRHKARLAAVGEAVSKINHDLRNMLSTAAVLSDRLGATRDPEVQKLSAPLLSALDRAISLCTQTLTFAKAEEPEPSRRNFPLAPLVDEVRLALLFPEQSSIIWRNDVPPEIELWADRDQVYRVLSNLAKNAVEALAGHGPGGTVRITAWREGGSAIVEIADTGPGLPPRAREHLFEAFAGAARSGGVGLGLTIARELVRAHGGEITLDKSDPTGSVFRLRFPEKPEDWHERRNQGAPDRARPVSQAIEK